MILPYDYYTTLTIALQFFTINHRGFMAMHPCGAWCYGVNVNKKKCIDHVSGKVRSTKNEDL